MLFKVVFLQFLYDLSDREIEELANLHLVCKWFAGLQPEEIAPDHSTMSRDVQGTQRITVGRSHTKWLSACCNLVPHPDTIGTPELMSS